MSNTLMAPVMLLEHSAQAIDVRNSKAPSDIWKGYGRVKTYNKAVEWGTRVSLRDLRFDQPFGVVSQRSGLNWKLSNRAYLLQLAKCNLKCKYCYVDRSGFLKNERFAEEDEPNVLWIDAKKAVFDFIDFNEAYAGNDPVYAGVFRISGGEPLLPEFQPWVHEVISLSVESSMVPYVWVDTNLTNEPSGDLLDVFSGPKISICGCFKPNVCDISNQLSIVSTMVNAGVDLYLYYPADGDYEDEFKGIFGALREIDENLPLRLNAIKIQWDYSTMKDRSDMKSPEQSSADWQSFRNYWHKYVEDNYDEELLLIPSHQVPIWNGNSPEWWKYCQGVGW